MSSTLPPIAPPPSPQPGDFKEAKAQAKAAKAYDGGGSMRSSPTGQVGGLARLGVLAVLALLLSLFSAAPASADHGLQILEHKVSTNLATSTAEFRIVFSQVPDFFSTDEYGRAHSSFQFYVDAEGALPPAELETIIRGEEIRYANDIVFRYAYPPDYDDLRSGGWGAIRGSVPYVLQGTVLTFVAPLALLGDADGDFTYSLGAYEYGGTTSEVLGMTRPALAPILGYFDQEAEGGNVQGASTDPVVAARQVRNFRARLADAATKSAKGKEKEACRAVGDLLVLVDGKPRPTDSLTGYVVPLLADLLRAFRAGPSCNPAQ